MHGLERTSACAIIVTNMPVSPLEFCRLVRKSGESERAERSEEGAQRASESDRHGATR
jgi:hypothetical protein